MHREKLRQSILRAQAAGFIGDDIELIVRHSERFAEVCRSYWQPPGSGADLGSGGGVPAFVIAERIEDISLLLIESMERRAAFLREEVAELGLSNRLRVYCGRGEDAGRDPELRERFELVTSRGFGPPSPTAEIGSALLAPGGVMVVSEPPNSDGSRWNSETLAELGLGKLTVVEREFSFAVFEKVDRIGDRYPRRSGVPFKRPLF